MWGEPCVYSGVRIRLMKRLCGDDEAFGFGRLGMSGPELKASEYIQVSDHIWGAKGPSRVKVS